MAEKYDITAHWFYPARFKTQKSGIFMHLVKVTMHYAGQKKRTLKELLMMPSVTFYCQITVHHCQDSRLSIV